ncbi:MAG: translation initiation factor IF-3, partial [Planctomycetota bacterium]
NHNAREDAFFRHNRQIRISPIRLIDADGEMQGVVPTDQALRMAQDAGLDLVEIAPNVRPPVCRILDYGKWKYEQQKKSDKQRAQQRHTGLKEVKIKTTKIDPHDLKIKTDRARKFLEDGHKVQITLQYRGREMAHQDIGQDLLNGVKRELFMISKVEQDFRMQGRRGNMVLSPDKKDPKKVRAPEPGEPITVGTKGVPLAEAGPAGDASKDEVVKPARKSLFPSRQPTQATAEGEAPPKPKATFGLPPRNSDDAVIPAPSDSEEPAAEAEPAPASDAA